MSKITNIEIQKKNKDRVNVYIEDEFSFACDAEIIYKQGLQKGKVIDLCKIKEIIYEDEIIKCKNSAIRTLERTYKTEKEIKDKLMQKGFEENVIESTLKFLREYKLINDNKFTDMYVKDRIKNQGRNKIKYSLKQRGISEDIISERLNSLDINDEKSTAYSLAKKKYDILSKREQDKFKLSQKLFRYLMGRGYSYECTSDIVKKIVDFEEFME